MKIIAGFIVKNEERDLPAAIKSIEPVVDGIVIYDTGSTDGTEQEARKSPKLLHYERFTGASTLENSDWKLWDFSAARNKFVAKIEELGANYVFWMDADDVLVNPDVFVKEITGNHQVYFLKMDLGGGNRGGHHRIWRTGLGIHFEGAVHEYPTIGGFDCYISNVVIKHNADPSAGETSNARNLRILLREWSRDSTNTRTAFYLANTYKDGEQYPEAVKIYAARIALGPAYRDEWLFSYLYKARCERALGWITAARSTLYEAISKQPDWSEFWMELAYMYENSGEWERAEAAAHFALSNEITQSMLWREENKYTDQPLRLLTRARYIQNDTNGALEYGERAKAAIGENDNDWNNFLIKIKNPKIALVRPGAIGDILMTLNIVPLLKNNYEIHYYKSPDIHLERMILESGISKVFDVKDLTLAPYHKVINFVGYPISNGYPEKPMTMHLLEYFANEAGIFGKPIPPLSLNRPNVNLSNYITIHPCAAWSKYKNWPIERWEQVIRAFPNERFVQIGGPNDPRISGPNIVFASTSLWNSICLIANSKLHCGVDSFSNHVTYYLWNGRQVPAVILWGSTQASASGYSHNTNISMGLKCQPCFRENPEISSMPLNPCPNLGDGIHECMNSITIERVISAISEKLNATI
jgi:ADP-heptose:LPS heptosyltransferase